MRDSTDRTDGHGTRSGKPASPTSHTSHTPGQTELFPASTEPSASGDPPPSTITPAPAVSTSSSATNASEDSAVSVAATVDRSATLQALLDLCVPVRAGSKAATWLKSRRIFRKTWDAQNLRVVENYRRVTEELLARFPLAHLQACGLFNKDGHLRFYRHTLLIPWFDQRAEQKEQKGQEEQKGKVAVYLQARSPDPEVVPPELSITGPLPCPYNARLLDGEPGRLYLCSGVLDTLELLEAGFPATGLAEGSGLKPAWIPRFRNKSVYLAFDSTPDGETAAAKTIAALGARSDLGIEVHRLDIPPGRDVGDWLAGR